MNAVVVNNFEKNIHLKLQKRYNKSIRPKYEVIKIEPNNIVYGFDLNL